ncbi:RsmD family RNA methyltransferase [Cellulomonas bogoriensis]|uniref:Methyltransferase n=1 Tax=Cellulomonas bogoriensis 69B4 = DSM 16987 TaxID=1386082 RepID=A0A0A0BYQ9_9CELL|nr:RsmD family RNA methyltransferase [Cellulomonas bogoriensis]KGM13100.1 methyltransferase [Cellulomonas bogoriensis 69B4 = DSM 16987]
MTRIVAGSAGGRSLVVPPAGTRPTSDRVREALFSRLEHLGAVQGAHVLDLFAGSGALGLEAASRGARRVVLVDAARGAARACERNVRTLGLHGVGVVCEKVVTYLRREPDQAADLVFCDPPYDMDEDGLADVLVALLPHLAPAALVVVERSARSPEPRWPHVPGDGRLVGEGDRRYGETRLWFAGVAPDAAGCHDPGPGLG